MPPHIRLGHIVLVDDDLGMEMLVHVHDDEVIHPRDGVTAIAALHAVVGERRGDGPDRLTQLRLGIAISVNGLHHQTLRHLTVTIFALHRSILSVWVAAHFGRAHFHYTHTMWPRT